jgi:1,4-dihydroxy-2-naphthoate octaprenyltransferase
MPVFWFSLSFVEEMDVLRAIATFIILHFLVYPASNGYNSYMDRDETSIGGIEKPLQPTRQLYYMTVAMDAVAVCLSFAINFWFGVSVGCYILCSRLYSYRGIRLKKYPLIGYLIVILNQGTLTFFMVYTAVQSDFSLNAPWEGLTAAAFLIGGFYPITQIYQHESDRRDGVTTISMLLGKRGTFVFCASMYAAALGILYYYYYQQNRTQSFLVLQIFFLPVLVYFFRWFLKVVRDERLADFKHTMQINWLASTCTSLAFITLILIQ